MCEEIITKEQEPINTNGIMVAKTEQHAVSIWNDMEAFERTQRVAKMLASSNLVPQSYRGNIADCTIAIDISSRMGLSPLAVMQNSQIVHGNFSWKGTACKAMIDSCGRYVNSKYIEVGERGKDSWGYYLQALDRVTGEIVKGVTVDIAMAKKEGWYNKNGSKWQTMPELMLKYRASAYFMRTECASLAMGFLTSEEQEDIYGVEPSENKSALVGLLDEEIENENKGE